MTTPQIASPSGATDGVRLAVRGVSKSYPGVQALLDVSLEVAPGEVHALVGENGAGKSTLMRLVAGVTAPDGGEITLNGNDLCRADERRAIELGVGMVHQERSLVPQLSVAENLFAARQPTNRIGGIRWRRLMRDTRTLLDRLGLAVPPDRLVQDLSPAEQQLAEIAKALSHRVELVILDEPTAALTIPEAQRLFGVIRGLRQQGTSVIYISHRLEEVFEIADRITVLKDGRVAGRRRAAETNEDELIRLMVGRDLDLAPDRRRVAGDAPVRLRAAGVASGDRIRRADLTVRAGEIVCLAGLVGAGRSELCEVLFGARRRTAGRVLLDERPVQLHHPAEAMRLGIGFVPEDRQDAGLFPDLSVAANVVAANLPEVAPQGVISARRVRGYVADQVRRLGVVTPGLGQPVVNLSGGNQQKVLLARWLARRPRVLIIDEPTRGVDVGARADIYGVIRELAMAGTAVLVVSSDLPEVLTLAHRIVVMTEGRTVGELDAAGASEESILRLASPVSPNGRQAA